MSVTKRSLTILATLALLAAVGVARGHAAAPEFKLRVADVYPVGHNVSEGTAKFFMTEVRRVTAGRVDFEYYPAEQLGKGKDMLKLILAGVIDIGLVVPSYISDKMPLSAVAELPGGFASSCQGSMAMWRLTHGGALEKDEFAPNGVRVLIVHTLNPFQLFTRRKITALDELKGQKIRSLGALMDITIEKLGGVPLHISAPEIHEALSRGTIDGGLMSVETVTSYDLTGLIATATTAEKLGGAVVTYAISEKKWQTLPADIQAVLMKEGEAATRNGCRRAEQFAVPAFEKLKAAGVAFFDPAPAERKKLDALLAGVAEEWAQGLDKRGKPGTEVLKAYRAALQQGS